MNNQLTTAKVGTERKNLFDIQREALSELLNIVATRARTEKTTREAYQNALARSEKELVRQKTLLEKQHQEELGQLQASLTNTLEEIERKFRDETGAADREYEVTKSEVTARYNQLEEETKAALQDARWSADSIHEAVEKEARKANVDAKKIVGDTAIRVEELWQSATGPLLRAGLKIEDVQKRIAKNTPIPGNPEEEMESGLVSGAAAVHSLRDLKFIGFLKPISVLWFLLPLCVAAGVVAQFTNPWWLGATVGAIIATALAILLRWVLVKNVTRKISQYVQELVESIQTIETGSEQYLKQSEMTFRHTIMEANKKRNHDIKMAEETANPKLQQFLEDRKRELIEAGDKHTRTKTKLQKWREDATSQAQTHFNSSKQKCDTAFQQAIQKVETTHLDMAVQAKATLDSMEGAIAIAWGDGQDRVGRMLNKLKANGLEHFPDWNSPFWYSPTVATKVPAGVRFGDFQVDLTRLPGGISFEDEGTEPTLPIRMKVPAFLPFPDHCSFLIRSTGDAREHAIAALQAIMLRLLTAIPPGKLRFTIIDPVGLGENFASFMHLSDYDEQLVGSRIWTEPAHIEQRLLDLTGHMETIIQKYLRNEYKTIEDYNREAGEVAEPFRVLVIANFPANFTLEAARRLVSIVNSGPSCGVYTLITHDPRQPLPQGFSIADLEEKSINLVWKENAFVWKDDSFKDFPLELGKPPVQSEMSRIVRWVGENSKNANVVEVPFEYVAPTVYDIWQGDSRHGLSVAIGRAGATRRQILSFGKGTAQHALIAGKTGSGKSTLLHALIVNMGLTYSPNELNLYLIDFKKGVEFKDYAAYRMPHAKAVAIESEREFGLSVLQKLDLELQERGNMFRSIGVNSIAEYRDHLDRQPTEGLPKVMPRILLVVDEFQEFFVEDDRLAQDAALLLDRLVRQGRAFGLHILLGSQTLGGAYSLARSTIDQMAIRIALQCSEADAQLILSKDNNAARLLNRPGEAIFNDRNGLIEGNNLFQVVWMSDETRENQLKDIRKRADLLQFQQLSPLVFEGNVPSMLESSPTYLKLVGENLWPEASRKYQVWLGDPIAIKDPTNVIFRYNSGQNLLIVGQDEELALSVASTTLLSLGLSHHPAKVQFVVLDGTLDDHPQAGILASVANVLPHRVDLVDRTQIQSVFTRLHDLVQHRNGDPAADRTPVFCIIHAVHRYRDLKKDDDFGFNRRGDKSVTPGQAFATILRDGPAVGVYCVVWADSTANILRAVDRQGLREFSQRILFQMSANDSSLLIDTPVANRLSRYRAISYTDETGQLEKFRPFKLPERDWLRQLRKDLEQRPEAGAANLPSLLAPPPIEEGGEQSPAPAESHRDE
ncbi:MAG: FtsK/SpoIIIE domain-containing protein [Zavarzinella sp.]